MSRPSFVRCLLIVAAAPFLAVSAAKAVEPLKFYAVTPCRLVDTRDPTGLTGGPALSHGVVRSFPIYGEDSRCISIPTTAKAAAFNVTAVTPTNFGHLTIFPYNTTLPNVSNINFASGEPAIANGAIVPLTVDSMLQISVFPVIAFNSGNVHLVLDITGYFQ